MNVRAKTKIMIFFIVIIEAIIIFSIFSFFLMDNNENREIIKVVESKGNSKVIEY